MMEESLGLDNMSIIYSYQNRFLRNVPEDFIETLDQKYSHFKNKDFYHKYLNNVARNYKKMVSSRFPLLTIVHRKMKPSYVYGYNIPREVLEELNLTEKEYANYGICILAYIPGYNVEKKRQEAARVYDYCRFINYDYLFANHRDICHLDNVENYPFYHICTNKAAEINEENFIYTPIAVARTLYIEYMRVDNGEQFRLECHEHGGEY